MAYKEILAKAKNDLENTVFPEGTPEYLKSCTFNLNESDLNDLVRDIAQVEKFKKVIDFLKLNFNISLDSKLRISDGNECIQTFIIHLPENTTIDEMFEIIPEVLCSDQRCYTVGYSKKELKMYIRYLKKTIKTLTKMDTWIWTPLGSCFNTINNLKKELKYYQEQLSNLKKGL